MARLRVRIELNRRMAGVPLDKMASVVEETRKFFYLLAEDVRIETERGEWVASNFDTESLNFTAEYGGPVSPEQVQAFGAAFSGATSLRKVTIAQFTRIADFLGEDELVGFGLYQSDQDAEPTEWRCLSKRDALRFGEEIKLLAEAAGEEAPETQLPAVMNASVAGRRLFKDRREEGRRDREALVADPAKFLRDMESNLARRIGQLEGEVAQQTRKMQLIGGNSELAEERFQKLLSAMETFWAQAPRQWPQLPAPAPAATTIPDPVPAPAATMIPETATVPDPMPAQTNLFDPAPALAISDLAPAPAAPDPAPAVAATVIPDPVPALLVPPHKSRGWSVLGVSLAAGIAVLAGVAFPDIQHQWSRFTSVETLPLVKPKPPAPPVLPKVGEAQKTAATQKASQPAPSIIKAVAARTPDPFVGPLIPLEVPASLKPKIQSEVRVDVVVAIDEEGNVTGARVASTKGDKAQLLVTEALRVARQSRFRPAREGEKTVGSQMLLTFLFEPISDEF
jgi:TonB-like protein